MQPSLKRARNLQRGSPKVLKLQLHTSKEPTGTVIRFQASIKTEEPHETKTQFADWGHRSTSSALQHQLEEGVGFRDAPQEVLEAYFIRPRGLGSRFRVLAL